MPTYRTADGAKLFYQVKGRECGNRPLVLVHGWCSNSTHWLAQTRHFSRRHRILLVDRRGMGRSETPGIGHTAAQHAQDIAAIAKQEGIKGAIVLGHAGGGPTTLELGGSYPKLARAIVMIDSAMYPLARLDDPKNLFGSLLAGMIDELESSKGKAALRKMYRGYFSKHCDKHLVKQAVDDALRTPLPVAVAELKQMAVSTADMARKVKQPTLWLTAAGVDQAFIQEQMAQVEFGQVVGAAHFPQMEVPVQTNAMLQNFIDRVR